MATDSGLKDQLTILKDLEATGGIPTEVLPKLQAPETQALVIQRLQQDMVQPTNLPDWASSPFLDVNPLSQTVSFKGSLRAAFLKQGFDHEQINQLEHKLSSKLGAYRGSSTFVGDLAKAPIPSDIKGPVPKKGTPEAMLAALGQNKSKLFGDVAAALQSEADPYKQAAIVRQAFSASQGGVNEQLLREFGDYAKLTDQAAQQKIQQQLQEQAKAGSRNPLGQILQALSVPGSLLREGIGLIENAAGGNAKTATGERVSAHTLLDTLKNLPRGTLETSTLGGASTLPEILQASGHDKAAQMLRDVVDVNRAGEVNFSGIGGPLADAIDKLKHSDNLGAKLGGYAADLAGNVATDPLTYLTFGAGGLGKGAATDLLKGAVERALVEGAGEDAAKAAAFQVANVYGRRLSFQGALKAYEALGYNPEQLAEQFPRVGFGRAAANLTQVRGGVTLRAGVPGTNLKAAVNLIQGGSPLEQVVRPQIISSIVDHAAVVGDKIIDKHGLAARVYRFGLPLAIQRQNPELAARFKTAVRMSKGIENRTVDQAVGTFRKANDEMSAIAKAAHLSADEFGSAVNDMVELGRSGSHYDELVARVGVAKANAFADHAQKINDALEQLRQTAIEHGVDVPELADQALGNINYLTHGLSDNEKQILLSKSKISGASKAERKITVGGKVVNPLTGASVKTSGTLNDINKIYQQMFGENLFNPDSFKQLEFYARAVGRRIGIEQTLTHLQGDLGFPTIESDLAAGLHGVISNPSAVRDVYLAPLNRARAAASRAAHNLRVGKRDTQAAARTYAETTKRLSQSKLETLGQLQQLRTLKSWNADNIVALTKDAASKQRMASTAQSLFDHERSIFSAQRDAEVRALREAGALPSVIKATSAKWEAYIAQAKEDFHRLQETVRTAPEGLRKRAEAHLHGLGAEAVATLSGASGRPYEAILKDAADTWQTVERLKAIQRFGRNNPFEAISRAAGDGEFQIVQRDAVALSQRLGDLQARVDNASKAGRFDRQAELQAEYDATKTVFDQLARSIKDRPEWTQQLLETMDNPEVARLAAKVQEKAADFVPVDDLLAEQRAAVAAGDTKRAAELADQISTSRELGARVQLAQEHAEAQQALVDLAQHGIRPDQVSAEMVRGLKEHLAQTIGELNDLGKTGRLLRDPRRANQALAIRYLREQGQQASILNEDWLQEESKLLAAVQNSHTLQESILSKQYHLRDLVQTGRLSAYDLNRAQEGLQRLTVRNADAVAKLLATPDIIEQMAPNFAHLGVIVNTVPGTARQVALPRDIYMALAHARNRPAAQGAFVKGLRWFTNGWKRGTLAIPGSTGRRMFGELFNATFYGGLNPKDLEVGRRLSAAVRAARGDISALPPDLSALGRGVIEQNILEGRLIDVYAEGGIDATKGLLGNKVAPLKHAEEAQFRASGWWEDVLRAGVFAQGKAMGLSDVGARARVAQFMFYNDELSPLESNYLRNVVPFWTYLRNNAQFQLYSLFQTPGRIAAYSSAQRTVQAPQEGEFGPSSIYEQGGFPLPIHNSKGQQEIFFPGTFDIPQGLTMIPNLIEAVRYINNPTQSNPAFQDVNPLFGALTAAAFGKNIYTGNDFGQAPQPFAPFGQELLKTTPRNRAIVEQLFPQIRQLEQLTAATPTRQEAPIENLLSVLVGPTSRPITNTTQNYGAKNLEQQIAALNQRLPASETAPSGEARRPNISDVRDNAKRERAQQLLEQYLAQLGG